MYTHDIDILTTAGLDHFLGDSSMGDYYYNGNYSKFKGKFDYLIDC